jgi:hypothetical protein
MKKSPLVLTRYEIWTDDKVTIVAADGKTVVSEQPNVWVKLFVPPKLPSD